MAGTTPFSPFSRAGFAAVTSPVRSHDVQALHEAVSKLQAQQVAQLELERQNQAVFDFVKAELGRVTQTISNLSSTVEDELRSLRPQRPERPPRPQRSSPCRPRAPPRG